MDPFHNKNKSKNVWHVPKAKPNSSSEPKLGQGQKNKEKEKAEAEKRFQAAKAKLEQSVQKHLSAHVDCDVSSSDEEDLQNETILGSVLQSYTKSAGTGGIIDLGRTQQFLENAFQTGAATCLICISSVKRADPIWSCSNCYCYFHLRCIQQWAADSIAHQKRSIEDLAPYDRPPKLLWCCPKCRNEYEPSETPQRYICFCGQVENPSFDIWLVPHSCGEMCNKSLLPLCGHKCLLLCHPGPCPPCPQTIRCTCYCGKSNPEERRCSFKNWSCGKPCKKTLGCAKHFCAEICHDGSCQACPRTSKQHCLCRANIREQQCATPTWQCGMVCGRLLSCGHHKCDKVCHPAGMCGNCPFENRTCPCGKTSYPNLSCTSESPTCGDTCGKLLACAVHTCQQKCHREQCGMCLQLSAKSCRCGLYEREMPCMKEFYCEVKCKRNRSCLKHPCNRKCCDGQCPPCEKICGKMLVCGKHKCITVCHNGPCYPCPLTEILSCTCGDTRIVLPCGRKKHVKPPKCNKACRIPPDCHHSSREFHKCHPGECPPCKQICGKMYESCKHTCRASCHSAVWVTTIINADKPLAGPWEKRESIREMKELPCPECLILVPVTCFGGHETSDWPCYQAYSSSCGRLCGKKLICGNHNCSLPCHIVINASSEFEAGDNCNSCEMMCSLPRPIGCTHLCLLPCHPAPCKPCQQTLKLKCHCGLSQLHRPCYQWTEAQSVDVAKEEIEKLLSCGNQCPKIYECGHRCRELCHSGECFNAQQCQRKVKVFCSCKRIRKEFTCDVIRSGKAQVPCDEVCKTKKREEKQLRDQQEEQRRQEQERKQQEELEKFEKWQQGKKKHRERRRHLSASNELNIWQKYGKIAIVVTAVALILGFALKLLST